MAYKAEFELVKRTQKVANEIRKLGINVKSYPANELFLTKILEDAPDLVFNLVNTAGSKSHLQTSILTALEILKVPYTGAGVEGLTVSSYRSLFKYLMICNNLPTPNFQYLSTPHLKINKKLDPPLVAYLNNSGGQQRIIGKNPVLETHDAAAKWVKELIETYNMPVLLEKFIDGKEITSIVVDDGVTLHPLIAAKEIDFIPDSGPTFNGFNNNSPSDSYTHQKISRDYENTLKSDIIKTFRSLRFCDFGKFDIKVDSSNHYFITDSYPNPPFGPNLGLPIMEIADLYGLTFIDILKSILTKYASKLQPHSISKREVPV